MHANKIGVLGLIHRHCDGGAYILSVAVLPYPSPKVAPTILEATREIKNEQLFKLLSYPSFNKLVINFKYATTEAVMIAL